MAPEDPQADVDHVFRDLVRLELAADPPPRCECVCQNSPVPHDCQPCLEPATMFVACHQWGFCNETGDAATDPDGNLTAVFCARCADYAVRISERQIEILLANLPPHARLECPTCGKPTAQGSDICETRPL